jgi:hypothetical protein
MAPIGQQWLMMVTSDFAAHGSGQALKASGSVVGGGGCAAVGFRVVRKGYLHRVGGFCGRGKGT